MTAPVVREVVIYVRNHARHNPDAPITPWYVRYPGPYTGKYYCARSKLELIFQIMQIEHPAADLSSLIDGLNVCYHDLYREHLDSRMVDQDIEVTIKLEDYDLKSALDAAKNL